MLADLGKLYIFKSFWRRDTRLHDVPGTCGHRDFKWRDLEGQVVELFSIHYEIYFPKFQAYYYAMSEELVPIE